MLNNHRKAKNITIKTILLLLFALWKLFPFANAEERQHTPTVIPDSIYPTAQSPQKLSPADQQRLKYLLYEAASAENKQQYDNAFDYLSYSLAIDSTNSVALSNLSISYLKLKQPQKAIEYARKAVAYNPHDYYSNIVLFNLCIENKQYKQAIATLQKIIQIEPTGAPEYYIKLAELYTLTEQTDKAIETWQQLETIAGYNDRILLERIELYLQLNQHEKAYHELNTYIKKYPRNTNLLLLLSDLYQQDSQQQKAWSTLQKAHNIHPNSPEIIKEISRFYQNNQQTEEALNTLYNGVKNTKISPEEKESLIVNYITLLQKSGQNLNSALALLDSLSSQHPQEAPIHLLYGNALLLENQKHEAKQQFIQYTLLEPNNPIGWEQLLRTAFPDSIDSSIRICKEAIQHLPEEPQFHLYLGIAYSLKEQPAKALKAYKQTLPLILSNPTMSSQVYTYIGNTYYTLNQPDSAFIAYDMALLDNPQNQEAINNYSYFLSLEKKDLDKAEQMALTLVKAEPTNPTYLDTYGWILFQQGAYQMAKIYLKKAIEYSTEQVSEEILEHYADVLYMTDEKETAVEYWQKAWLQSDKKNTRLQKKISSGLIEK